MHSVLKWTILKVWKTGEYESDNINHHGDNMSNIPKFSVNSKPQLSQEEFDGHKKDGGKFLNEPGTYDLTIKSVDFKETTSDKDSAWVSTTLLLESPEGRTMKHFVLVPVECRNSFLFGADKGTFALEGLQKFLRGLGIAFDFDNGMQQVAAVFGNPDGLIGKTIKARVGYKGPTIKYLAKNEYQVVKSDYKTLVVDGIFANPAAAEAAAAEAGIAKSKLSGFINVLEIFPSATPQINVGAPTASIDVDLPF